MSCPVCCEKYTQHKRRAIECVTCHHAACMQCQKRYILGTAQPECMACHANFSFNFICRAFPSVWVRGEYSRYRADRALQTELDQMPHSQHLVHHHRLARTLRTRVAHIDAERTRLRAMIRSLEIERWNVRNRAERIEASGFDEDGLAGAGGTTGPSLRRDFIRKCPIDECRGFLSSALVCGVCTIKACARCWQAIVPTGEEQHHCVPEDVRTAELLQRETRPCPRCAARISKVEGCNQMWCTSCNSAFMWHTGAPVTGPIHNVHYFEYLRRHPPPQQQQPATDDANERISMLVLDRHLREPVSTTRMQGTPVAEYEPIMQYWRYMLHIRYDYLRRFARADAPYTTRDLRLQYLLGQISPEELKIALRLREKKHYRQVAMRACYETKMQEATAALRALCAGQSSPRAALAAIEASHIRGNQELREVAAMYGGRPDYGPAEATLRGL